MKSSAALLIEPRILRREAAAFYCGLSAGAWDAEWKAGRAPGPVAITSGVKGWDRQDLDLWIESRKAEQNAVANPWDEGEPA